MDGGEVTLELHGHYADEASARAAVRDYIEEWEFKADLTIGAGKLRLEFIRAEIVDRDPVFGIGMCHWPATIRTAVGRLRMGSRCSYGTSDRARP